MNQIIKLIKKKIKLFKEVGDSFERIKNLSIIDMQMAEKRIMNNQQKLILMQNILLLMENLDVY